MSNFDLALSVGLGIGLAAATGFRLFLPLLTMNFFQRGSVVSRLTNLTGVKFQHTNRIPQVARPNCITIRPASRRNEILVLQLRRRRR